jgi:catechol 2,3-dioxygenase-like lactoylglutathione lyase family enzyme
MNCDRRRNSEEIGVWNSALDVRELQFAPTELRTPNSERRVSVMLRKIDRVILRVPSVAGAAPFYRDVLKLPPLRQETHVAGFALPDGGELILIDDPDQPFEQVFFLVDDVRKMYARREELKLHFLHPPRPSARGFRATVKDPFGTVLSIVDRTAESAGAMEDAAPSDALFPGSEPDAPLKAEPLIRLYKKIARTADDLPYTPHFEKLYNDYTAEFTDGKPTRRQVWRQLLTLRKGGDLPKLGAAPTPPPDVDQNAIQLMKTLLGSHMGKRDRLPYTPEFDKIVDEFNAALNKPISPHLIWRLVARLAK